MEIPSNRIGFTEEFELNQDTLGFKDSAMTADKFASIKESQLDGFIDLFFKDVDHIFGMLNEKDVGNVAITTTLLPNSDLAKCLKDGSFDLRSLSLDDFHELLPYLVVNFTYKRKSLNINARHCFKPFTDYQKDCDLRPFSFYDVAFKGSNLYKMSFVHKIKSSKLSNSIDERILLHGITAPIDSVKSEFRKIVPRFRFKGEDAVSRIYHEYLVAVKKGENLNDVIALGSALNFFSDIKYFFDCALNGMNYI